MKYTENGRPGALWMPRSRGSVSGLLLVILGAWGALIPFVGPHFNFAYTPDQDWAWSTARGWLEVLPGAATVACGLLLIVAGNRITAVLAGCPGRRLVRGRRRDRPAVGDRVRR